MIQHGKTRKEKYKESPVIRCKRRIKRGKKFPGVQPFPYTDQYHVRPFQSLSKWECAFMSHKPQELLKLEDNEVFFFFWKDQIFATTPKISTGTTRGSDMQRGRTQLATRQRWISTLQSSMNNVPWLVEKSHLQLNKYFYYATFPLKLHSNARQKCRS